MLPQAQKYQARGSNAAAWRRMTLRYGALHKNR